jgi:hypothetical protein
MKNVARLAITKLINNLHNTENMDATKKEIRTIQESVFNGFEMRINNIGMS